MRTVIKITAAAAVAALSLSGVARADTGLRLNIGMSHITYDDFNNYVDEVNKTLNTVGLELDHLNWLPEIQGEFIYSPLPLINIGVGAGVMMGKAELNSTNYGNIKHGIRVYPLTLTGYFKPDIPFMPVKPFVFGGLGVYYSKISCEFNFGSSQGINEETDLTASAFGVHAGAGLEFSILPLLSLEFAVRGRWVDIKGFEGEGVDANGDKVDVFLISEGDMFGPGDVADKDQYREGSLGLTGYGFTLGLKLVF